MKRESEGLSASGTFANDPIIEEMVEDSAHATKRQSLDKDADIPVVTAKESSQAINEEPKKLLAKKPIAQEQKNQII